MDVSSIISYIGGRLREPSTYAGFSAILIACKIIPNDPSAINTLTTAGVAIGGILAALFPEQGAKK